MFIDYTKPIKSDLDKGNRIEKVKEIINAKPSRYDARKEIDKAIKNIRDQGLRLWYISMHVCNMHCL